MWTGKFKYKMITCSICKKEFKAPLFQKKRKFCSLSCFYKSPEFKNSRPQKGIIFSKERNQKISKSLKGRQFSKQHKENIRRAHLGLKQPEALKRERSKIIKKLWQDKDYREKSINARKGENNPNWKGGISFALMTLYHTNKYKNWRRKVFERDNFVCHNCGYDKGHILEAHHIKKFNKYSEL